MNLIRNQPQKLRIELPKERRNTMDTSIFEQYESEVRSYCRKFPKVFTKAKGSYFYDEDGKKYLDFFCGAGAVNYGHNNDAIKEKVLDYLAGDGVIHSLDMYTVAKREFLDCLESRVLKARGMDYKVMFPGPTGTNAIESALKLARKVKKRNTVWAFMGAFHGMTLGALALTTDMESRGGAGVCLNSDVVHIPAPYMFPELDTIHYMQTLLDDDHSGVEKPAALVLETVQAEGGIYVFSAEYLQRLSAFCKENDILLIIDDIQVGCARTGTFLSFERAGIQPDIFVMSKSIGGMGFPLAITLFKPELDVWAPGEHNGTFRGNQTAFVAAKAAIEFMLDQQVEAQVQRKAQLVERFMNEEILPLDSRLSVRGIGLIWGVDFGKMGDGFCAKVQKECFARNLIIESAGRKNSVLKLMPTLVIDENDLLAGLAIIRDAIKAAL